MSVSIGTSSFQHGEGPGRGCQRERPWREREMAPECTASGGDPLMRQNRGERGQV